MTINEELIEEFDDSDTKSGRGGMFGFGKPNGSSGDHESVLNLGSDKTLALRRWLGMIVKQLTYVLGVVALCTLDLIPQIVMFIALGPGDGWSLLISIAFGLGSSAMQMAVWDVFDSGLAYTKQSTRRKRMLFMGVAIIIALIDSPLDGVALSNMMLGFKTPPTDMATFTHILYWAVAILGTICSGFNEALLGLTTSAKRHK